MLSKILLASPLDLTSHDSLNSLPRCCTRGKKIYNKKNFLNKCYVEPRFLQSSKSIDKQRSNYDDSKKNSYYDEMYSGALKSKYETFIYDLIGDSASSVFSKTLYMVIGPEGSGKTTFATKLLSQRSNIYCTPDDFTNAGVDSVSFVDASQSFNVDAITPINSIKLIIVRRIGSLFYQQEDENEKKEDVRNKLIASIRAISSTYKKYFLNNIKDVSDSNVYKLFFTGLSSLVTEGSETIRDTDSLLNGLSNLVNKVFVLKINKYEKERKFYYCEEEKQLIFLTGVYMRLAFCVVNSLEKYRGKKILLFVDNIERALPLDNRIFLDVNTSDIKVILRSLYHATANFEDRLGLIRGAFQESDSEAAVYETTVAILFNMRDSTHGILQKMKDQGSLADIEHKSIIRIANWYDSEEIINKRLASYLKKSNGVIISTLGQLTSSDDYTLSSGVVAYNNIIGDKGMSKWNLCDFIELFYGNSKRSIANRFVSKFLHARESKTSSHDEGGQLKLFNDLFSQIDDLHGEERQALKQLCRKYLIRLLLDFVKKPAPRDVEFFHHRMNDNFSNNEEHYNKNLHCYARRIMTFLSERKELYEDDNIDGEYVDINSNYKFFSTNFLIGKLILCDEHVKKNEYRIIKDFSEILFYLNESLLRDTNWTGLVCIEIDSARTFTIDELRELICRDWEDYKSSNRENIDDERKGAVVVRATEAGSMFSLVMADFEYFASRYGSKESELPPILKINEHESLQNLLNGVKNKAFKCIEIIIQTEKTLSVLWKYKDDKGQQIRHESRIINHHIGYLYNYVVYVNSSVCKATKKYEMIKTTVNTMGDYINFARDNSIAYVWKEKDRDNLKRICTSQKISLPYNLN